MYIHKSESVRTRGQTSDGCNPATNDRADESVLRAGAILRQVTERMRAFCEQVSVSRTLRISSYYMHSCCASNYCQLGSESYGE